MNRLILAAVVMSCAMWGQEPAPRPPAVRASGDAVVRLKPDQVKIDIGVVTQAASAQTAASQNATQLQTVLSRLRAALGSEADIRTISYSVSPNYQFQSGRRTINGYLATNLVQVTTGDLSAAGKIIDTAMEAGSNEIQQIQFSLRDDRQARAEALKEATLAARANAEAMAAAMGRKLGPVLLIDQGGGQGPRPVMAMAAAINGAPTPVEAGTLEVRATVTLTVALE